jgi:hypothetical protein
LIVINVTLIRFLFDMEHYLISNDISGVMVSMLASSVVDRWFKPWSGQAMVGTSHGRDKPWSGQAMVRTSHGRDKPWSGQAMVGTSQRLFDWYLLFLY